MNPADLRPGGRTSEPSRPAAARLPWLGGAVLAVLVLGAVGGTGATGVPGSTGAFGSTGALGLTGAPALASAAPSSLTVAFHGLGSTFPDGAPARVAGGFGGDTCLACHWEFDDAEDAVGSLQVSGVPEAWKPGERYTLDIEVKRPGMVVGGFQLAARFTSDTTQAGAFRIPEQESGRIAVLDEGGLLFAQHTEDGIPAENGAGRVRWSVIWEAPDEEAPGRPIPGTAEVVLNVSAVAGDGDRSQMGDYVYSAEFRIAR
ncbi:MAG: hypothetical protein EA350_08275 [Gemmatimonadales bacterium]|nr:MAG: hypothetical protein EA350_08275 [Gemmatimonadales bacterium]